MYVELESPGIHVEYPACWARLALREILLLVGGVVCLGRAYGERSFINFVILLAITTRTHSFDSTDSSRQGVLVLFKRR